MERARVVPVLLAVVVAAAGALAALALASISGEVERARERYRERVDASARSGAAAVEAEADPTRELSNALAWSATDGGELVEPAIAAGAAAAATDDAWLVRALEADVDRLLREGDREAAVARLRDAASREDRPSVAAAALTALAALEREAGRAREARTALEAIVARFQGERDERGLERGLAARFALCELDGWPEETLTRLYADAVAARRSLADTAVGALAAAAARELAARAPARLAQIEPDARERMRALRFRAAWSTGVSDWVASGAAGATRVFEVPHDPLVGAEPEPWLVRALRDGDRWRGEAVALGELVTPALARAAANPGEIEIASALATRDGRLVAGDPRALDARARIAALAAPLDGLAVRAIGLDVESYVAGERRRAWLVAGVVSAAIVLATAAAIAGARAISRESRLAREREAFVAAVTHELKAPLASIRLLAELIERGGLDEAKAREFGGRTVAEADRLSRLVSSVLRLAKIERAPRDGAARERFDLADVARAAIETFEPAAKPRGFTVELRAPRPAPVEGDRDALVGAAMELLDNAAKHAREPHALEVEVAIAGERRATLAVLDRGAGVPAGEERRVFEPFHRAGDELTRERPGVGLGLAIVQRVAEAHGGVARYAPRDGGGSRFTIELPLAKP